MYEVLLTETKLTNTLIQQFANIEVSVLLIIITLCQLYWKDHEKGLK